MLSFEELGLSEKTLKVLKKKGFEEPTPIQEKTIPYILEGDKDLVAQAQTGTGKTAAFGLPIMELIEEKSKFIQVLILTPTRELAIQVAEEINSLSGRQKLSIIPIYGGQSMGLQLRALKKGVNIVVATPGRLLDHIRRSTIQLEHVSFLVLDEADEMLNMGFLDDVRDIMEKTSPEKRTFLFSATMPMEIMSIAKKYMGDYNVIKTKGQITVSNTDQIYFEVSESDKFEALCRIIDIEEVFYGLVFCRTKVDVDRVAHHMHERGYDSDALHGDISQAMREKILNKFRKKNINILIATDVAARGIDVQDLTHVINYALPQGAESYIHRIGRTGRAGKEGIAITFITPAEYRKLKYISREIKTDIRREKLPKVADVINTKKLRIRNGIEEIINQGLQEEFFDMSRMLLESNEPEDIISALLQYSFKDELDQKSYREIKETVVDKKGKTRLFVARGRRDGFTPVKLMNIIREICDIQKSKIRDIEILDNFSFVTLPFNDAEAVLSHFKKMKSGKAPIFTKAKEDRRSGRSGRSDRSGRPDRADRSDRSGRPGRSDRPSDRKKRRK
jgi:ATP-dependent RNA helicase DeaD